MRYQEVIMHLKDKKQLIRTATRSELSGSCGRKRLTLLTPSPRRGCFPCNLNLFMPCKCGGLEGVCVNNKVEAGTGAGCGGRGWLNGGCFLVRILVKTIKAFNRNCFKLFGRSFS